MIGLLAKAHRLRDVLSRDGRLREDIQFDSESGISKEDQREILKEIEKVATASRMKVTPEAFVVRSVKRGVLFPIAVNVSAILALGICALGFYFLFQRGETRISREQPSAITAEGRLIEEVKKDAEAKLEEKNRQIGAIQQRLTEIDRERENLQTSMDAKVSQREKELRDAMAGELEAEREKLKGQGLSEGAIEKRIQDLEARQSAEFARQLDAYRTQAEQERKKSEESLKSLQAEFTANLAKANEERLQVLSDSRKREDELRRQLEQKTQALESERARAEQVLTTISAQRAREDLASGQLIGLYQVARADIDRSDYPKALLSLQAVRDYVSRPDVISLPAIAQRREFDLFVVDSLAALVRDKQASEKADTSSLVDAANQVGEIRARVSDAEAFLREGRVADAEKSYGLALQVIPDVVKSFSFLIQAEKDTEANRQLRLRDALARAEAALAMGNTADSLAAYREAFAYLPESSERLAKTMANIEAAAVERETRRSRQEQSRAAAPLIAQGAGFLAQDRPEDALVVYVKVLAACPLSSRTDEAARGIDSAVKRITSAAAEREKKIQADLASRIAALEKELASRQPDPSQQKVSDDLHKAQEDNKKLLAQIDSLTSQLNKAGQSGSPAADSRKLKDLQGRLSSLDKSYRDYTSLEDPILADRGVRGLVDSKAYLDSFLGSKPVDDTFPGLLARIKRYDQGFQSAGRSGALQDAIDAVIELSSARTSDARRKFFDEKLALYSKDPDMTSLLTELRGLLR